MQKIQYVHLFLLACCLRPIAMMTIRLVAALVVYITLRTNPQQLETGVLILIQYGRHHAGSLYLPSSRLFFSCFFSLSIGC